MNTHIISIVAAIILLPSISIAQFGNQKGAAKMEQKKIPGVGETVKSTIPERGKAGKKCKGAHFLEECLSIGACKTSECPTGQYCIGPQAVAPATATKIKEAQCVKPDAIGEATCADPGSKKIELVVKGITVPVVEKCQQDKPICLMGQCVAGNQTACIDSDLTNYTALLSWSQKGNKQGLQIDPSLAKAGSVSAINAANPNVVKEYKDQCKGDKFLLEQACDWGVAKEVGVNCNDADIGAICITEAGAAGGAKCGFKDSDNDGITDKNDNCVKVANPDQKDADGDGQGDACDKCPNDAFNDIDGDTICADKDNCKYQGNIDQSDVDKDGMGDVCDDFMAPEEFILGNGLSVFPSVSADGRFVVFDSYATNLVPGDNNGVIDIFVRDRKEGTTERVSVSTAGV